MICENFIRDFVQSGRNNPSEILVHAVSLSEPMQNEPSGLLSDPYLFAQLQARDTLAGRYKQVHGIKPLVKRHVRPLEDSLGSYREVQFAGIAAIKAVLARRDSLFGLTFGPGDAIRPETAF